jgi:hypothetical protein
MQRRNEHTEVFYTVTVTIAEVTGRICAGKSTI